MPLTVGWRGQKGEAQQDVGAGRAKIEEPMTACDVLIATIGMRDPETEHGPTGPLRAAQGLRPRTVLLIALPEVVAQAGETSAAVRRAIPGADVRVITLDASDPVDIDCLQQALDSEIGALGAEISGKSVAVCGSSGTPQLGLALTLMAMARFPGATHYQALAPQFATGPLLREFDPDVLRHHTETANAFDALESCQWALARRLFESRLASRTALARGAGAALRAGRLLATALLAAEKLDAAGASRALSSLSELSRPARRDLEQLKQWYAGIDSRGRGSTNWPVELAALARRQQRAGAPAQALISAAIAMEAAIAVRFRTQHGLDLDKLKDLQRVPEDLRGSLVSLGGSSFRLEGAEKRSRWLERIDPEYARMLRDREAQSQRKNLTEARNDLVHQGRPLRPEALAGGLEFLDALFRAFGWRLSADCPSSPQAVAAFAALRRSEAGLAA